jgi:hypothetical protein
VRKESSDGWQIDTAALLLLPPAPMFAPAAAAAGIARADVSAAPAAAVFDADRAK